jgi:hypothetical protein
LKFLDMLPSINLLIAAAAVVLAHGDHGHGQTPLEGPHKQLWYNMLPGDGGTQVCAPNHNVAYQELPLTGSRPTQSSQESPPLVACRIILALQTMM